jgi:hypothetical protein
MMHSRTFCVQRAGHGETLTEVRHDNGFSGYFAVFEGGKPFWVNGGI